MPGTSTSKRLTTYTAFGAPLAAKVAYTTSDFSYVAADEAEAADAEEELAASPSASASALGTQATDSVTVSSAPKAVYVVNRFDVEVPGTVVDHGDYTSVQNLTNETELARIGDATTFEAEEGTLYYQGDAANAALPWNVSLSYELDGKKVEADQLAGASGNLAVM